MNRDKQFPLVRTIIISIIIHLAFLQISKYLPENLLSYNNNKLSDNSPMEIEHFKKTRTVGVKNGLKDFAVPVRPQTKTEIPKKLSLSSLNPGLKKTMQKSEVFLKEKQKTHYNQLSLIPNQKLKQNVLKKLNKSSDFGKTFNQANFNIAFSPPEGVSEDELNSFEKMFYSFQKRTYLSYLSSFIKTYNQMLISKPNLKNALKDNKQKLKGRIIFDKLGNIVSIKITRWSNSDEIQELFEETLKEIRSVPNPPKAMVQSGEFYIYYQLNIN